MPPWSWEAGNSEQRWAGYFLLDSDVLRNKVDATTLDQLRDAENDLVEARLAELRAEPALIRRVYDSAISKRSISTFFKMLRKGWRAPNRGHQ